MPMETNDELVDYLVKTGRIESERVEQAFRSVDRGEFVETNPYVDKPAYLDDGATVSAPHMVAQMIELLEPEGKVLEMGSGSGYVLALLNELADEVVGVERIEKLVERSREKVSEARVILGDSVPDEEFDRVLYSFAAENVEPALRKSDVVVAPEQGEQRQVLKKYVNGETEAHGRVRFVGERSGIRTE